VSRIGLITNPNSGPKANPHTRHMLQRSAAFHLIPVAETHSEAEIGDALHAFARAGVEVLVIHGGDGTVDAVLTRLRTETIFETEPVLALLPGGTTNMTHGDVGIQRSAKRALGDIAAACFNGLPTFGVHARRPIRVERTDANRAFYGFFFATAAIPRVIRLTRERLHKRGVTGKIGEILALAWSLPRLLTGRVEADTVLHPDHVRYALDGEMWREGHAVVLLATSLKRLVLGMRPAPPGKTMGVAALMWPYRGLARRLPGFLRGRGGGALGDDLGRTMTGRLQLQLVDDYTVDGELFAPPADGHVTLSAAREARFLVL
jgi:hypothetical protein